MTTNRAPKQWSLTRNETITSFESWRQNLLYTLSLNESIESIWQSIRVHYGFQSTGAHFIDLMNIQLKHDERPEDLFQRLMAFVEDSLLHENSGLTHHGEPIQEEEELTPTLENFIVLQWLHLLYRDLPALV